MVKEMLDGKAMRSWGGMRQALDGDFELEKLIICYLQEKQIRAKNITMIELVRFSGYYDFVANFEKL